MPRRSHRILHKNIQCSPQSHNPASTFNQPSWVSQLASWNRIRNALQHKAGVESSVHLLGLAVSTVLSAGCDEEQLRDPAKQLVLLLEHCGARGPSAVRTLQELALCVAIAQPTHNTGGGNTSSKSKLARCQSKHGFQQNTRDSTRGNKPSTMSQRPQPPASGQPRAVAVELETMASEKRCESAQEHSVLTTVPQS